MSNRLNNMEMAARVVRDDLVAIVYSPGFGAGWYTWNTEYPEIVFDPTIVKYVETKRWDDLKVYVELKYPEIYAGGMDSLQLEWVPVGAQFKVTEYDGSESIEYRDNDNWLTA